MASLAEELQKLEPLQPASQRTAPKPPVHYAGFKDLPDIGLSRRYLRSTVWTPPTIKPNSEVAVYYLTDDGFKSDGVEPAKVLSFLPEARQVAVRLRGGDCKVVPMSWVLDPSLAGGGRHPWRPGAPSPRVPVTAAARLRLPPPTPRGLDALPAPPVPAAAAGDRGPADSSAELVDVDGLKAALLRQYGSVVDAWEAMDAADVGQVTVETFTALCEQLHFIGDASVVFAGIDTDGCGFITLRLFRQWMATHADPRPTSSSLRPPRRSAPAAREVTDAAAVERKRAADGARLFKLAMLRNFNSLAAAWVELDTNQDGYMQFHEFCAACRRFNFRGCLRSIWAYLVENEPEVDEDEEKALPPERLDPTLPAQLAAFKAKGVENSLRLLSESSPRRRVVGKCPLIWPVGRPAETKAVASSVPSDAKAFRIAMRRKFPSLLEAWVELDEKDRGQLTYGEFVQACRRIDFVGNLKQVFEDLTESGELLKAEALDPALPAQLAKMHAEAGMRRSSSHQSVLRRSADFAHDNGPEFRQGPRKSAVTAGEVRNMLQDGEAKAGPPSDAKAFRDAIIKKFGTKAAAWAELDNNGQGAVSYRDFVAACRRINFAGNLRHVFEDLAGGSDILTAADL